MLVMQCTSDLDLRGMASVDTSRGAESFAALAAGAHCAVTVDAGDRPYQGIVEIDGTSLAASLEHYFARSVQVPSHVMVLANDELAAGVLLQQVPGQLMDEDDWSRLHFLIETLTAKDFESEAGLQLIGKLFAEDDVRVYESRAVNFRCRCSARKTEDVLKMLGESEARQALEERGNIEVICEYCGHRRHFDAVDVERLFADNVVPAPNSVQ